jgi:OmpA-OmpF porin, OOP family
MKTKLEISGGHTVMKKAFYLALALAASQPAFAQEVDLTTMSVSQARPEVQRRFDEALAATKSAEVLASLDSSYMWASEAKVQCGIALGFLKSSTIDKDSLSKCERFHRYINQNTPPVIAMPEPPAPPRVTQAVCESVAATFFFDWNSAVLPGNVDDTVASVASNMQPCGWNRFVVTGHTDRSGTDSYNDALSIRRAQAVAARMQAAGIAASATSVSGRGEAEPKVSTADGERNPTNRRVEITASN